MDNLFGSTHGPKIRFEATHSKMEFIFDSVRIGKLKSIREPDLQSIPLHFDFEYDHGRSVSRGGDLCWSSETSGVGKLNRTQAVSYAFPEGIVLGSLCGAEMQE